VGQSIIEGHKVSSDIFIVQFTCVKERHKAPLDSQISEISLKLFAATNFDGKFFNILF